MIRGRYLAVIANEERRASLCDGQLREALRSNGLEIVLSASQYCLAVDHHLPFAPLREGRGGLLGLVHGPDRIESKYFQQRHQQHLPWHEWQTIMRDNWGDFIVFQQDAAIAQLQIARSPQGQLPCYYTERDGATFVSSDVRIFEACGHRASIDDVALYRHLLNINLRPDQTCLAGVMELQGGHVLDLKADDCKITEFWNPWRYASRAAQLEDLAEAPSTLRKLIIESVRKTAGDARHVLLGLSGGLDSSIMAASLAEAGVPFSCLTLVTKDASGDERHHAQTVAAHLGAALYEMPESMEEIDLLACDAAHLPRPVARAFAQSGNKAHLAVGAQVDADAFMSGGGGDNIFCFMQSARPLADMLRTRGMGPSSWRVARDLSQLTDSSIWTAWRKGIQRAWFRPHDYAWVQDASFVDTAFHKIEKAWLAHPWTAAPSGELPGKAQHIAWILGVRNHVEGYGRELTGPTLWPLLTQPVVEYCLRLPTWAWIRGGRDRVIAREAFASLLPPQIIRRRSKGTPDSFVVEIFERNRGAISELLCEGWLAAHGLIDRDAVALRCRPDLPTRDHSYWQIMRLVDAEAWVRSWTTQRQDGQN